MKTEGNTKKYLNTMTNDALELVFKKYIHLNYKHINWGELSLDYAVLEKFIKNCPKFKPEIGKWFNKMLNLKGVYLERKLFMLNLTRIKFEKKNGAEFKIIFPKKTSALKAV